MLIRIAFHFNFIGSPLFAPQNLLTSAVIGNATGFMLNVCQPTYDPTIDGFS